MMLPQSLFRYFAALGAGKIALWCYLIWYLITVTRCFDPSPAIWLNAVGISAIIGSALVLSVSVPGASRPDPWQTFRLFLMPFCVSTFSSLTKGKGYLLILPPTLAEQGALVGSCTAFVVFVLVFKLLSGRARLLERARRH